MKAAEKTRQKLSFAQTVEANAKYGKGHRWKCNINSIQEFLDYMVDDTELDTE